VATEISTSVSSPAAQRLAELGLQLDTSIPYRLDSLFPKLTGWGSKQHIKKKHKLITRIEGRLKGMLQPGEEVLYVAKGVQYKFSEQYFLGIWAALINQTVFVLTNLRLLLIHSNTKGAPRHTYWTIYYSQIDRFKPSWTGKMPLKLCDRTTFNYTGFDKLDRQRMPEIFQQALAAYQEHGFAPQVSQSRENLCSYCFRVVSKEQYRCEHCGGEFWTPGAVALRSLIFPSWGDFVTGHTSLAIVELMGYGLTWLICAALLMDELAENRIGLAMFFLVVILGQHLLDAALTYFIAKKGLAPRRAPQLVPE
jgi:hypothetical protein